MTMKMQVSLIKMQTFYANSCGLDIWMQTKYFYSNANVFCHDIQIQVFRNQI